MKKMVKIQLIFDIEKWLWKSELHYSWPSKRKRTQGLELFMHTKLELGLSLFILELSYAQLFNWSDANIYCDFRWWIYGIQQRSLFVWAWDGWQKLFYGLLPKREQMFSTKDQFGQHNGFVLSGRAKKYLLSDIIVLLFTFICCWYRFLSYIRVLFWLSNANFKFQCFLLADYIDQ